MLFKSITAENLQKNETTIIRAIKIPVVPVVRVVATVVGGRRVTVIFGGDVNLDFKLK